MEGEPERQTDGMVYIEPTARAVRLAIWIDARLAELPRGGSITVTWRRDRAGHISRDYHVNEGRILREEDDGKPVDG